MGSEAKLELPVLDFTKEDSLTPGTSSWVKACTEVRQALEEYGCFVVDYKKIPQQLIKSAFGFLKDLFDLPLETKIQNKYDKSLAGYVGQIASLPLHESMGIDNATSMEAAQNFTKLMWPNGNDPFRECVYKYATVAVELDQMVARMIFESYGVEKYCDSYIKSTAYLLRLLKNRAPKEDTTNRLAFVTHTDKSFTTILHQNEIDGLEVDTKDGKKINVGLSPSLFVVLAGDALMAWSNDRIAAPVHRVIMNGKVDRYSLGLFAFNSGKIQVPEELVDEEHPLMYNPLDHIGLLHFYYTDEGRKSKCPVKAYCGVGNRIMNFVFSQ